MELFIEMHVMNITIFISNSTVFSSIRIVPTTKSSSLTEKFNTNYEIVGIA